MKPARTESYGLIVRHVARAFTRVLQDGIAPFGITAGEYRVLRVIEEGPRIQSEIAQLASMDRPFVATLLKKLAARGLVAAHPNPSDGRRVDMRLTPAGLRLLRRIIAQIVTESDVVATKGISAQDLRIFADVSRRIVGNLERHFFAPEIDEA